MSRHSLHERAETERRRNRQSIAILVTTIAVVGTAAVMLRDPSALVAKPDTTPKQPESQPLVERPDTVAEDSAAEDTAVEDTAANRDYWHARVAAIKNQVPQIESTEVRSLLNRLNDLNKQLPDAGIAPQSVAALKISQELDSIQRQLSLLAEVPANVPVDSSSRIAAALVALEEDAVELAVKKASDEMEQNIRNAQLALYDELDTAASLREQIASTQREQTEIRAKTERAEALARDMADVREYLKPFTSPGYLQPSGTINAWHAKRTADAMPVSLSALDRLGALEPTMDGYEKLYMFGTGMEPSLKDARPLGSFPKYRPYHLKDPPILVVVKRAQDLLRQHGQALIEAQMLIP